jgi:BirA family biotin operon repressor/biotin-[acetyl-CoA-carboxylase] ligase
MSSCYISFIQKKGLQKLNTELIGKKIIHFKKIDSTNQYALNLIKQNVTEGTVVISDIQTKGRGRKKRFWDSPLGGLWFSIILYPRIQTEKAMLITMTASISISQAIKKITGLDTEIKWPNDILLNGKKLCGVLTELESEKNSIKYAVIGIGINVNNKISEKLKDIAISIKNVKGVDISYTDLFKEILKRCDYNYKILKTENYDNIRKIWISLTKIIDKKVEINQENRIIYGKVCDIDENGHLIIQTPEKKVRINVGDINFL